MSTDDVARFFHHVHQDKALQEKMRGTLPHGHAKTEDEIAGEMVQIASDAGFTFTAEEYKASLHAEMRSEPGEVVSEEMIQELSSARGRCAWNSIISSKTAGGGTFFTG